MENLVWFFRMIAYFDPFVFLGLVAVSLALVLGTFSCKKAPSPAEVVVCATQDQVYAELILCSVNWK